MSQHFNRWHDSLRSFVIVARACWRRFDDRGFSRLSIERKEFLARSNLRYGSLVEDFFLGKLRENCVLNLLIRKVANISNRTVDIFVTHSGLHFDDVFAQTLPHLCGKALA